MEQVQFTFLSHYNGISISGMPSFVPHCVLVSQANLVSCDCRWLYLWGLSNPAFPARPRSKLKWKLLKWHFKEWVCYKNL